LVATIHKVSSRLGSSRRSTPSTSSAIHQPVAADSVAPLAIVTGVSAAS
jgi:hypothetical protein